MAKRPKSSKRTAPKGSPKAVEQTYRGKLIRLEPAGGKRKEHLVVDGRHVEFERTSEGVVSHAAMYAVYGSPFELAEELIRQWGESEFEAGHSTSGSH